MRIKLKVDGTTTAAELRFLAALFADLAAERAYLPATFVAPTDEAELPEAPDPSPLYSEEHPPTKRRRRRTKAEIEAAAAASTTTNPEPEVAPESDPTPDPAPTPTAPVTDTTPTEPVPAASEPATESPSDTKTYTPAEVQKIAVATAGRFGPEKVKAIIAQYPGAARIADIPVGELAGFVAKLNAVS